jgi:Holliday junction resolvase
MANKSKWKNFEREIAQALGGKRRLRTMESFGKTATDVFFPKYVRMGSPWLKHLQIECKKRRQINIHAMFAEATLKYKKDAEDKIILATRVPATKKTGVKWQRLKAKFQKTTGKKLRRMDFVNPLVTVDLPFFVELFQSWQYSQRNYNKKGDV